MEVAKALDLGPKSGNFFYLTSAAKHYGLTEGTNQTAEISLTDLGRKAVYPSSPEEERQALRAAFLNVPTFRKVLEHYGGNNLPEKQYRENTLFTKFDLDPKVQDEFVELLTKNSRFTGIGERVLPPGLDAATITAGAITGSPRSGLDAGTITAEMISKGSITEGDLASARTIAKPEESDENTPVCFVIMPFIEHEDRYAPGFFEEVLESLFTPAIVGAGLEVRTAKRQGSDLIHSTIINELLAADLVLADLTEHNPNVLFELGMRIAEDKPVVLVRAKGTGHIFDVDQILRIEEYSPNVWPSTVKRDQQLLQAHIAAAWENRESGQTYRGILTQVAQNS